MIRLLFVLWAFAFAAAQQCPTATPPACPYDLTFTGGELTTNTADLATKGYLLNVTAFKFAPTLPGKYTFRFSANDLCSFKNTTVTVSARCPVAPVARAVATPSTLAQGGSVSISGASSSWASDFTGVLTYQWSTVSAPAGSGFVAGGPISGTTNSISFTNLLFAGTYIIALRVDDGCSFNVANVCFQVVCNCGPSASAMATTTVWSNYVTTPNNSPATGGNANSANNVRFALNAGNSFDFDLLYTTSEKLTYSWAFVSWVPATRPVPYPAKAPGPTVVISDKNPALWTANEVIAATTSSFGYSATVATSNGAGSDIVNTYTFTRTPLALATTTTTQTTTGSPVTTSSAPTNTTTWVPAYNNDNVEEWFQTFGRTLPVPPTPDEPVTTSIAALVATSTTIATVVTVFTTVTTTTTPSTLSPTTFCQIRITQTQNGAVPAASNHMASLEIVSPYTFDSCRGLWTFTLTVMDGCGAASQSTDTFVLTIRCNRPPVAILACNNTVVWQGTANKFDQVTVDGRSSNDMDNSLLTYYWQFTSIPQAFSLTCTHAPCVQSYCNDPNKYTGIAFQADVNVAGQGTSSKTFGNGNSGSAVSFTQGTNDGTCCTSGVCGPTVYPVFIDPNAQNPSFATVNCRQWAPPPASIAAVTPAVPTVCPYGAWGPTGYHVGNSAYFTPSTQGTYVVQLSVFDGCSLVSSTATVLAMCPSLTFTISLNSQTGTFSPTGAGAALGTVLTLTYGGDAATLTYQWSLAPTSATTATFNDPTLAEPVFNPTVAPRTYIVQLTINDGCQTKSVISTPFTFVCNTPPGAVTLSTYTGSTATGSPMGANAQVTMESSGAQYPFVTLKAGAVDTNTDPLTYVWTLDANYNSLTQSTNGETITFRPFYTAAGGNRATFQVTVTVYANDGCSSGPTMTKSITFTCDASLQARAVAAGGVTAVSYAFTGNTGSFPSVVYSGMTSSTPYPTNTNWGWGITYSTGTGSSQAGVASGIVGATSGTTTPITNITFTPAAVGVYSVTLTTSDNCMSNSVVLSLQTSCATLPTAVVTTPTGTVDYNSRVDVYVAGWPTFTLRSNSTAAPVTAPATNTMAVVPLWTATGTTANMAPSVPITNADQAVATFTPIIAGLYEFQLVVSNGVCFSTNTNNKARVTARCLTITASVVPPPAVVTWDGVRFPTVELDGTASTYLTNAGAAANYNVLKYTWLFTASPTASMFKQVGTYAGTSTTANTTVTTTGTPQVAPLHMTLPGGISITVSTSAVNVTQAITRVVTTPSSTIKTTLFNHHYNKPMTCFKPDVVGTYAVSLSITDGCAQTTTPATQTTSVTTNARCNTVVQPSIASTSITVTLNGTSYQRVLLNAEGTRPATATDTLTYQWTLSSVPHVSSGGVQMSSKLVAGSAADVMNAQSNMASFVPDVAGTYTLQLAVNDGCNAATSATVTVSVSCTNQMVVEIPKVAVSSASNLFVPTAANPIPWIPFVTTASRFNSGYFTVMGEATNDCTVLARKWSLLSRICAEAYTPIIVPPATPAPTSGQCVPTRTCVWEVESFPCQTSGFLRPLQCAAGTGNSLPCVLTTTTAASCSATFTPRSPGLYVLKLTVTDGCSTAIDFVNVTARCGSSVTAVPGGPYLSNRTCSTVYTAVTLNGNSSVLDTSTPAEHDPCPIITPAPTPAPTQPPSTRTCCPIPTWCAQCPQCPQCPQCGSSPATTSAGVSLLNTRMPNGATIPGAFTAAGSFIPSPVPEKQAPRIEPGTPGFTSRFAADDDEGGEEPPMDQFLFLHMVVPLSAFMALSVVANVAMVVFLSSPARPVD